MRVNVMQVAVVWIVILVFIMNPVHASDCGCGGDGGTPSVDSSDSGSSSGYGSEADPAALSAQARQLFTEGKYGDALDAYNSSLTLDPFNIQALMGKGDVLFSLQRYPEAVTVFRKVLSISPSNDEAYVHLGNTYLVMKEYQNAANAYERSLGLRPSNKIASENLQVALRNLEDAVPISSPSTVPSPENTMSPESTVTTIATITPEMTIVRTSTPMIHPSAYLNGWFAVVALVVSPVILFLGRRKG